MFFHRSSLAGLAVAACLAAVAPTADASNRFDGLWCGTGLLHEFSLKLQQLNLDHVEGVLKRKDRERTIEGSVSGNTLRTETTKYGSLVLEAAGSELRILGGDGPLSLARGTSFQRARGAVCGS